MSRPQSHIYRQRLNQRQDQNLIQPETVYRKKDDGSQNRSRESSEKQTQIPEAPFFPGKNFYPQQTDAVKQKILHQKYVQIYRIYGSHLPSTYYRRPPPIILSKPLVKKETRDASFS